MECYTLNAAASKKNC